MVIGSLWILWRDSLERRDLEIQRWHEGLSVWRREGFRKEREKLAKTPFGHLEICWGLGRSWNDSQYCSSQEFLLPSWHYQDRLETGKLNFFPWLHQEPQVSSDWILLSFFVFGPWLENHRKKGWDRDKSWGGGGAAAYLMLLWLLSMEFLCKWTRTHLPLCSLISVHPPIVHGSICPSFHFINGEHVPCAKS